MPCEEAKCVKNVCVCVYVLLTEMLHHGDRMGQYSLSCPLPGQGGGGTRQPLWAPWQEATVAA